MKKLVFSGVAICVALIVVYLIYTPTTIGDPPPPPKETQAEHPDYYQQWFEMKKDENGEIPSGLYTAWYDYDQQQLARYGNRIAAAPFASTDFIGPNTVGGRTRALLIDASNENRIFAGCISGGLWRSTNGGTNWSPLNDAATSLGVSCISQSPLNSNNILYGTGESRANSSGVPGDGVFRSTNGGASFTQLSATTGIAAMDYCWAIQHSKTDVNTVYLGTNTGGLYRSTDNGNSWSQVYSTGSIVDIVTFNNGGVLIARRNSGLFYSPTGNSGTFTQVTDSDFPSSFYRIEIAEYKANDNIVYAAFEKTSGGCEALLKSTDGGTNWTPVATPSIGQTYSYYCFFLGVSANNSNRIACAGVSLRYSTNGGSSWSNASTSHADHHSFAAYTGNPDEMLIGNDGGVFRFNWNSMNTFTDLNDGYYTTQFYAGDFAPTGTITIGGTQDNGTFRVGSNFKKVRGGDGAYCHISQQNGAIAYSSYQNGSMSRTTNFTATTPSWSGINTNTTMNGEGYLFINPYQINYADGDQLYCRTSSGIWRTNNQGSSWSKLTGSISGLFAIGCTQVANPTVYIGGSSARFYRINNASTAAAGSEVDLSASVPSSVTNDYLAAITPHPSQNSTLYIGFSDFKNNPRAWKVTNSTAASPTWTNISGDLPTRLPVNYIQADPNDPDNSLFAATDFGLYYTTNGGTNWIKEPSIPNVSIHEMKIRETDRALFLFTHGRGIWKLDLESTGGNLCLSTISSFPYSESFESGIGAWTQDTGDDLDWSRDSGGTPSTNTGPTTGSDGSWYMYIESSSPNFPSKTGNLGACFNFSGISNPVMFFDYHMYGAAMGTLNLQASVDDGANWATVWTQSGDQGNVWNAETVALSTYANNSNVRLRWNGTTATSYTSDMTVDNIRVQDVSVSACSGEVSSFPYSESFESGTGAWAQESGDDFDWSRDSGGTPSVNTGPTTGSDGSWYMYVESSSPNFPSKTTNQSACFDLSGLNGPGLTFDYHMYGSTMGTLNLQISINNGSSYTTIWTQSGDQGNAWQSQFVDLSPYTTASSVKLRWNGTTTTSYTSDMAIDNIRIEEASLACPELNFDKYTIAAYGGGQDQGSANVQGGGSTLFIQNNAWKSISYNQTVTSNTYLSLEFASTIEGEIHGIGFDNDNSISSNYTFKFHGTQNWGLLDFDNYAPTSYVTYTINVGAYYTGVFDRMFFVADHDGGAKNGNSYFRNVIVSEGPCSGPPSTPGPMAGQMGNQAEFSSDARIYPNPFTESVQVDIPADFDDEATIRVFDGNGRFILSAEHVSTGSTITLPGKGLPSGMYTIQVNAGTYQKVFKVVKMD